jgi:cerevisin
MFFTIWSFLAYTAISVIAAPTPLVPIHRVSKRASSGGYIVKFKDGAVLEANRRKWIDNQLNKAGLDPLTIQQVGTLKVGWRSTVFDGFAGQLSEEAIEAFRATKDVEYIAEDGEAWVTEITAQTGATWGLQRLSQPAPLSRQDEGARDYTYVSDNSWGQGVDVYIVDTGVEVDHPQFEGRARFAQTFGDGVPGQDKHGHGTHVAGIAASRDFGVSRKASIIAVKVMRDDGRGDTSNIIAGVNFAVGQAFTTDTKRPSVINISIISDGSPALDAAVENAVKLGIHVVVGAGNDGKDTAGFSPARSPSVITVGATNIRDTRSSFSNFGKIDVFAPGEKIISTFPGGTTQVLSGTSMSSPFISGLVAYLIALDGDTSPADMKTRIQGLSSQGLIASVPNGTDNRLAFNGVKNSAPTSTDAPSPSGLPYNEAQKQKVISAADGLINVFKSLSDAAANAAI